MQDIRLGTAIRLLRQRRRWTQAELGARAGVSDTTISRIERGHIRSLSVATIQDVAGELDVRIDLVPRWRSGDLDRLLNRRHSTLHELVARWFGEVVPDWVLAPEVSYSIYRGARRHRHPRVAPGPAGAPDHRAQDGHR